MDTDEICSEHDTRLSADGCCDACALSESLDEFESAVQAEWQ